MSKTKEETNKEAPETKNVKTNLFEKFEKVEEVPMSFRIGNARTEVKTLADSMKAREIRKFSFSSEKALTTAQTRIVKYGDENGITSYARKLEDGKRYLFVEKYD